MTTYTITTSVNIDSLASKAGNDTYNINGGYLTIDQDSRYGTNSTTSSIIGPVTLSATLGGTIEFNATKVRLIPYDGGSGTVPVSNTVISGAAGSGKLIGVYSALDAAPTAAAAAMPGSGYIKIKQWNDGAFINNEALSGITATVNGTDHPGWIEVAASDSQTCTVNRLNTFKVRGEWYNFLGATTDGNRATTYQIPSNGSSVFYLPGVWVETAPLSGTYEFYPCAGSRAATIGSIGTEAIRGKFCWISTTGLLRFGHDGTNSTGGYCPENGCKIRIPNIFFMTSTSGAPTVNVLPNATPATRYDFTTTGGGNIDIDKASMNWFLSILQGYSCYLSNSSFMTSVSILEVAAPLTISNVGVGQEAANAQTALTLNLCFAGGAISDLVLSRASLAANGGYILSISDISGFIFTNLKTVSLLHRTHATSGCATIIRATNCRWESPILIGGRYLLTTCDTCEFNNTTYIDMIWGTTWPSNPTYAFILSTKCVDCTFDGLDFGNLSLVQPYAGLVNIGAAACSNIKIRNIGSITGNLDLGGPHMYNAYWHRTGTIASITTPIAHSLKTGDIVYGMISSDISAIVIGSKTVTGVPSTNRFQFAALNAGGSSGLFTYYPTMTASLLVLNAGAAANDIKMQRVYTDHNRGVPYSSDNSSKNILIENVFSDPDTAPLMPSLNQDIKNIRATPPLTAQTSVYGTHFFDAVINDINTGRTDNLTWRRTTTLASGSSYGHKLHTNALINIYESSSAAAVNTGRYLVTGADANLLYFPAANAGNSTGWYSYTPLNSIMGIQMNEQSVESSGVYFDISGSTSFSSAGGLVMTGRYTDSITFETPYYILGYTGFNWAQVVFGGAVNTGFHLLYSIDKNDGSNFSEFRNLNFIKSGSIGVNNSLMIGVPNIIGINTGDYVFATNTAGYAKVTGLANNTGVYVDRPHKGIVSGPIIFNYLYNETGINPGLGFKQRIKIISDQTGSTAITSLYWFTAASNESLRYQYPLDTVETSLNLINLVSGTEVHVYNTSTDAEVAGVESTAGSTFTYNYTWTGSDTSVYITTIKTGYQWIRYSDQILNQSGLSIPVFQSIDRNYRNP